MRKTYTLSTISGMKNDTMELVADSMKIVGDYIVFENCNRDDSPVTFPEFYIKQHVVDLIMVENKDD